MNGTTCADCLRTVVATVVVLDRLGAEHALCFECWDPNDRAIESDVPGGSRVRRLPAPIDAQLELPEESEAA